MNIDFKKGWRTYAALAVVFAGGAMQALGWIDAITAKTIFDYGIAAAVLFLRMAQGRIEKGL